MRRIIIAPHPVLTTPVKPITAFDQKLKKLIEELKKTLEAQVDPQGVGLAAPQIGVALAVFVIKPTIKAKALTFVNPQIIRAQDAPPTEKNNDKTALEGCLSIPRIWSPLKRAQTVAVSYQNEKGERLEKTYQGLPAVIIQHEIDHLQGILFTKRALEQKTRLYKEQNGKLELIEF